MKTSTPKETVSCRRPTHPTRSGSARIWDYHHLCEILPDRHSRLSMVKELLRQSFFIRTQPDVPELVLDPVFSTAVTTSSTEVCQKILKAAKADFLGIYGNLLKGSEVSKAKKTLFRYYCEALLVFRHMQCPGAVEGFMVNSSILKKDML